MAIFRFIFSIIFAPIRLIANFLTQRKDNLLEWHLNYGPSFVKIQTIHKEQILSDDLLIAGYLHFLARYFRICDDRQTNIVQDLLLEEIVKSQEPIEITQKLYEVVFQTLNQMEKDATIGLFRIYDKFLPPMPPLTFSEDEEPKYSIAKYKFFVFKRGFGKDLINIFHMSSGPDIILLPLTVGILYEYIINKFQDKNKKEKLDNSIIDLLKKYSDVDCRSIMALNELPNEIIKQNNLNY